MCERDRGDEQRASRAGRELLGPPGEGTLERRSGRHRLRHGLTAFELRGAEQAAGLEDGERVPAGSLPEPSRDRGRGRAVGVLLQQACRVLGRERREVELLESRQLEVIAGVGTRREQEHDGVGHQPLRREEERLRRGAVEPLGVVDDDEERVRLRRDGKQVERRGADREAVERARPPEAERVAERVRLRLGQLGEVIQQGPQQLEQAGAAELRL